MRNRVQIPVLAVVCAAALTVGVVGVPAVAAGATTGSGTSSSERIYMVRPGDTVESIARANGVSAADVRVANGIPDGKVYVGSGLVIRPGAGRGSAASASTTATTPSRSAAPSAAARPAAARSSRYTVKKGDYLARIARRHHVKLPALLKANGMTARSLIRPGDRLTIPGTASTTSSTSSTTSASSTSSQHDGLMAGWPSIECPVPGATFMDDWGFPRDGGRRFHQGNDMFAPRGTTIYAPAAGTIVYSSNHLGGSSFNITTTSGWNFYGAHLSAPIGGNRHVRAGEPIARVGDSGDALGGPTHLYFQFEHVNGRPMNPYQSLVAACRS